MSILGNIRKWLAGAGAGKPARPRVGEGSRLSESVQVYGWEAVRIGRQCVICEDTLLNALNCPGTGPVIEIGDFSFIGRRNFLNAGARLALGEYCLTGTDCHFLGSDHVHTSPFTPYLAAGNTGGGEIVLGPNVWLGARVTVLKNVTIGHGSIIGAAGVVTANVPPFALAVGQPARVIKRFSISRHEWVRAEEFSAADEAAIPTAADFLASLRQSHPRIAMPHRALGRECGDF